MKEVRGRTLRDVIDEVHAASGPEGFASRGLGLDVPPARRRFRAHRAGRRLRAQPRRRAPRSQARQPHGRRVRRGAGDGLGPRAPRRRAAGFADSFGVAGFAADPLWDPRIPVVEIDWHAAMSYCRWLSARTKRAFRLPNELEREKAARAPMDGTCPGRSPRVDVCVVGEGQEGVAAREPVDGHPTDESVYTIRGLAGNVRDWREHLEALGPEDRARAPDPGDGGRRRRLPRYQGGLVERLRGAGPLRGSLRSPTRAAPADARAPSRALALVSAPAVILSRAACGGSARRIAATASVWSAISASSSALRASR